MMIKELASHGFLTDCSERFFLPFPSSGAGITLNAQQNKTHTRKSNRTPFHSRLALIVHACTSSTSDHRLLALTL